MLAWGVGAARSVSQRSLFGKSGIMPDMHSGLVGHIQRFSLHDGPEIRTTVFLKGCPLGCLWCYDPENRSSQPEVMVMRAVAFGAASASPFARAAPRMLPSQSITSRRLFVGSAGLA